MKVYNLGDQSFNDFRSEHFSWAKVSSTTSKMREWKTGLIPYTLDLFWSFNT